MANIVDIVFLVDNTGSMGGYIANVKGALTSFANSLTDSHMDYRLGLVEFGDINDSSIKKYAFTTDIETFINNVASITMTGGGDYEESGLEALVDSTNGALSMDFRSSASKRFILTTDASFHNKGEDGDGDSSKYLITSDVQNALLANDVILDVVGQMDSDDGVSWTNCEDEYKPIANATGGNFYDINSLDYKKLFEEIAEDISGKNTSDVTVDLNDVGESTKGVFTINPILGGEVSTDTSNNAIFKAAAEDEDTVVGHVTADKVYISAAGSTYRQNIIIPENWKVTATDYNDYLNITGDNASIMGGNGSDTFAVGSDVSVVKFADFKTEEDNITFSTAIPEHSLTPSTSGRPFTLSSYDINLAFQNMSNPNEAFYNKNVTNGSDTNIISDLIVFDYDAITAVNINLAKVGSSTDGVFVVNPVIAGKNNKNITADAIFKDEAEGNEIVVGNITDEKIYVAETSTPYNQNITIPRNWDVTATANNDYLNITGNNASVAGGAGVDNFYVASGVSNVNFVDFTPNEDYLAFADMIPEASLKESADTGELSLFSDNINLNFQNMPYLTTDLALTTVGNGSTQNTVQQLIANPNIGVTINPTAPVMMSFSHWSYGFNPPTE